MAAMSPSGCLSVVLNARATPEDMLKAYFQCVVFWEKVRLGLITAVVGVGDVVPAVVVVAAVSGEQLHGAYVHPPLLRHVSQPPAFLSQTFNVFCELPGGVVGGGGRA